MGAICSCCFKEDNPEYEPLLQDSEREAVADLLSYLENRTAPSQANGAAGDGSSSLFQEEPLKALTTLSYSPNIDLQRSAALAFAELTERWNGEVDSAVLDPLLYLLRNSNDIEVQRASSAALGNLAVNLENKVKIVRLGGLEPLIRQMHSGNVEVQCNAVGCITNLATCEENKSMIAQSGALQPLVRLAKSTKDTRVQRNATGALLNMTHSEENRKQLVDAGAIPVLVSLLRSGDQDVVYYCTTSLSNLAVDAFNRKKLSQEGRLVNELVDLMDSDSSKIQCQAALALRNLASDEKYQLEIALHPRSLGRLLGLLNVNSNFGKADAVPQLAASTRLDGKQLVLAAVACIRNISIHPQNESRIIDAGFLPPLVALLSSDNEEIQCHAVSTLRNLAAGNGVSEENQTEDLLRRTAYNKEKIIESGVIEKIKDLIDLSSTDRDRVGWPVLSEMTACIAVLALSDKLKPLLLEKGVVKSLIPLTKEGIPSEVQGNSAAALGNLATKGIFWKLE
jgi:vacuolar protein 8